MYKEYIYIYICVCVRVFVCMCLYAHEVVCAVSGEASLYRFYAMFAGVRLGHTHTHIHIYIYIYIYINSHGVYL